MIKELTITDIALDRSVRTAFRAIKKDMAAINRRLCLIENCQHCKYTCSRGHK